MKGNNSHIIHFADGQPIAGQRARGKLVAQATRVCVLLSTLLGSILAFAGQGFFITIKNDLPSPININPYDGRFNTADFEKYGRYQNWYPKDFESSTPLSAGEERRYYTEVCENIFTCRGWATLTMLVEGADWGWSGHLNLSYYIRGDNPVGRLSCYASGKGWKQSEFKYKEHIELAKPGDQYVGTIRVTPGGLECN